MIVRPDGKISVPLINEVQAAGQTPDQLRLKLVELASKYMDAAQLKVYEAALNEGFQALPGESLTFWQEQAPETVHVNEYGPTETVVGCCVQFVTASERVEGQVPIGRPIANTTLYVLDPAGEPAPVGVAGELYIGGAGVCTGYLGRTELTAERFVPDRFDGQPGARLYRTGDRARWRADGVLEYLGRLDFQVKIRGFRIELGEIESVLISHAAVQAAVVLSREDVPGDKRLVAYVVPAAGAARSASTLRAALQLSLPEYMVPSAFVFLDLLPLTSNGKVDRGALPAPDATASDERYVAPRTPVEQTIADVWAQVLGVPRVGRDDDFFALGGHSLLAMRAIVRLAELLPRRLTIGAMFEARTVAALAARAAEPRATTDVSDAIPRASVRGSAPLSIAQQAVWTAEQRHPDTAAYNVPLVVRVRGPLDVDALDRAIGAVVARHEVLRTSIEERGGEPVQIAHESVSVPVERLDLRATPGMVDDALTRTVRTPFVLTRAPLLRALVARTGEAEGVVAIVAYHLVFDGGSEPLFKRDLAAAYEAIAKGDAPALGPLAIEFSDWARWERAQSVGPRLEEDLAYWREALAGAPSAIDLPTDLPLEGRRDARAADEAARVVTTLPPALLVALSDLAREQGATLFMVLLAGFQTLLARFSRQDDLVVGTPVSGRDRPETQPLIGFLANTLPMRATLEPSTSFAALIAQARERLVAGFEHGGVPVERVASELGRGMLFDTLFVLQEGGEPASLFAGCETEPAPVEIGAAKMDLSLSMTVTPEGLRAVLIYRTARFHRETAERLLEHLGRLLAAAAESPSTPIADLPLLGETDRARLAA